MWPETLGPARFPREGQIPGSWGARASSHALSRWTTGGGAEGQSWRKCPPVPHPPLPVARGLLPIPPPSPPIPTTPFCSVSKFTFGKESGAPTNSWVWWCPLQSFLYWPALCPVLLQDRTCASSCLLLVDRNLLSVGAYAHHRGGRKTGYETRQTTLQI